MLDMSWGVMRTYCLPFDAFAVSIYTGWVSTPLSAEWDTHHHLHANTSVDGVHEDIEFIWKVCENPQTSANKGRRTKATNGTTDGFPQRQEQTDGGERFLASTERAWILVSTILLRRRLVIRLDLAQMS